MMSGKLSVWSQMYMHAACIVVTDHYLVSSQPKTVAINFMRIRINGYMEEYVP